MARRKRLTRRQSKSSFRKGSRIKKKNVRRPPMRGGFRI